MDRIIKTLDAGAVSTRSSRNVIHGGMHYVLAGSSTILYDSQKFESFLYQNQKKKRLQVAILLGLFKMSQMETGMSDFLKDLYKKFWL